MTAHAGVAPVTPGPVVRGERPCGADPLAARTPRPGQRDPIERVRAALSDVAAGRPVVLVDGADGGDLVVASDLATPEVVSFVVRHTAGFVCVAVPEDDADRLDLPLMVGSDRGRPGAAQCVAVDGAGGGTGISATDRARTIRLLASPDTVPSDLVRPGHVVPLRVGAGGLLASPGRAEAAADLAGLAGLQPSGALCALVSTSDPTRMARGPELDAFARAHGLCLVSISDLVAYRMRFEALVERGAQATLPLPAGGFTAVGYRSRVDGAEHLALVHGDVGGDDVAVHVHRECLVGDTLGSSSCGCGAHLRSALGHVADVGRGVVVYLRSGPGGAGPLRDLLPWQPDPGGRRAGVADGPARDRGVAAQILRDLGVRDARLLDDLVARGCAAPGR
ncbi:3,4-dihydroxy-2-butanone-4-phosphate synthase [Geodermatophilus sp. SYSU D01105]